MKMYSPPIRSAAALLPATVLLLSTLPALAAGPSGAGATAETPSIDEIVVTAQKREQRIQDVPISLSVVGGAELDKSSIQSVSDALGMVPGVAVNVTGQGGETKLTIRGVTAAGALFAGPSPIGYYLDSVPFGLVRSAVQPDANSYDLNRIEVLRGPQGTLYGASALNGVVRVLTNDANLNNFEFKMRASTSNTEGGGENYRGDFAVNAPIIPGKLAARAVVDYNNTSGWLNNAFAADTNTGEVANLRLKINARPTDNSSIKLNYWHSSSHYGAPSVSDDKGFNDTTIPEPYKVKYDTVGAP